MEFEFDTELKLLDEFDELGGELLLLDELDELEEAMDGRDDDGLELPLLLLVEVVALNKIGHKGNTLPECRDEWAVLVIEDADVPTPPLLPAEAEAEAEIEDKSESPSSSSSFFSNFFGHRCSFFFNSSFSLLDKLGISLPICLAFSANGLGLEPLEDELKLKSEAGLEADGTRL